MKKASVFCLALCLLALTACGSAPKVSEEASDLEVKGIRYSRIESWLIITAS